MEKSLSFLQELIKRNVQAKTFSSDLFAFNFIGIWYHNNALIC